MKDYYKILEVNENASKEVIDKAYKVLVKKYHPDMLNNNSNLKIIEINEAYSILSDDHLKEQYDRQLQIEKEKQMTNNYVETDYSRIYREKERNNYKNNYVNQNRLLKKNSRKDYTGILELTKDIIKNRPTMENIKNLRKINIMALILTILIMIFIGLVLYCIPDTRQWLYKMFPIFN